MGNCFSSPAEPAEGKTLTSINRTDSSRTPSTGANTNLSVPNAQKQRKYNELSPNYASSSHGSSLLLPGTTSRRGSAGSVPIEQALASSTACPLDSPLDSPQDTPPDTLNNNDEPENKDKKKDVKILLLGSGESGKSTIVKQMKIIHQNGFSENERLIQKPIIFKNLIGCAQSIANALIQFKIPLESDPDIFNQQDLITIINSEVPVNNEEPTNITFDLNLTKKIKSMWNDKSIKKLLTDHRSSFYLMDSASYFFENIDRISELNYIPNSNDLLRARNTTTGIIETKFQMGKFNIHMFDIGGQRSERRKWIHTFDNVSVIIFCVAISEYDQVLLEEKSQNRMVESLILFKSIVNSRWFQRTAIVLFLNKIDIFTEKLKDVPLENYFPNYTGGNDIHKATKYILWLFTQCNQSGVAIYPHITQATDTSNIKVVFTAVQERILTKSLEESGIL